MNTYLKAGFLFCSMLGFSYVLYVLSVGQSFPLIDTAGSIAQSERNLIFTALLLMLTVVVPVLVLTLLIAWRYSAKNVRAKYTPNWEHNTLDEVIWWTVPCLIVGGLAVLTVRSSYELDPFKPIESSEPTQVIQVVALNWKWLFIYPREGIATVNYVVFPAHAPVDFVITADAPMNSFWIPQLAGQVYAMPGMVTHLHLIADKEGTYSGSSANFSGPGFADMRFKAKALSRADFNAWVDVTRVSPRALDARTYDELARVHGAGEAGDFSSVLPGLFDSVVMRYMMPPPQATAGMDMMHN